jgi:hypothetical protein
MQRKNRIGAQLAVLIPTIATSALLGHYGMPVVPRLVGSLGVGMILIRVVSIWQRGRE